MAGMDWLRWHHGSVTDPKFQLIAKKSSCSVAEVIAFWAFILESASQAESRGSVEGIDLESVECLLGLDDGKAETIYNEMKLRGLIGADMRVSSWEKRQPKREREDDSQARVKAYRERQEEQEQNNENQVTPSNASINQKTPRVEKSREDKSSRATASRLPADWTPSDADQDFCRSERPDLDPSATADRFRDYWIAQPGAKGRKLDWPATWRNWVRAEKPGTFSKPVATVHQLPDFMRGAI